MPAFLSKTMATFSASQRSHLLELWSKKNAAANKRIHEDELESIRAEKEQRSASKQQRQAATSRKRHAAGDMDSVRDRSQMLAEKSRSRLAFSRFRSMNEFLYTHTTGEAVNFMDEQCFQMYHAAYSEIADKWPIRPIDHICNRMRSLFKNRGKGKVFADMGCGSKPLIADAFPNATVHSYDLISKDDRITQADVTNVPLGDGVCDCVVFSLSLMGSNIAEQVKEGSRILKENGILIIAEVTSRFKGQDKNKKVNSKNAHSQEEDNEEAAGDEEEEQEIDSLEDFASKLSKLGLVMNKTENLEPNSFFVILEFIRNSKTVNKKKTKKQNTRTCIRLKACQYKPR
jgi:ribosomal RNA-processing protein 8